MKKRFSLSIALICLLAFGCNQGPRKPQITFSHILGETSEWHVGAREWKKRVDAQLGDQINIRLVTHASLSNNNQRNELEMVQAGTLGGSWESSILLTNSDPRWTVWSLPWLFDSYQEAEKLCESEVGEEMLQSLQNIGIVGLAYGFNGFRHLTNRDTQITALQDMKNLKIRVPSLQMYISLYRLWGADPSQMNFGDLTIALREGTMDGQENPLHVIRSSGLYQLQKELTLWHYSFDPLVFCMSQRVWNTLTPDQQTILRDAARQAATVQRKTVMDNEEAHIQFLKENGVRVTTLSPASIDQFKQISQPLYQEYKPTIGEPLLTRFLEQTQ